jgi:ISXO2-like transposase domain
MEAPEWTLVVLWLQPPRVSDRWDDLSRHPYPLTLWFAAAWLMTSQKNGIPALGLKRVLNLGSEQTAWAMLHRFRTAMVRPGRDRLTRTVEVDEAFFGGPEPGRAGRGALGKTMVAIAVEVSVDGSQLGRCRMSVISDAEGPTLRTFVEDNVEPGSLVVTDGWAGYQVACKPPYRHDRSAISRQTLPAHELLPAVHRVAGLAKRWLLGTHQGGVKPGHLQAYLNEFTFRLNRRNSDARGRLFFRLLEQAVLAEPRTFRSLVAARRRAYTPAPELPPPDKHVHAESLARDPLDRPWRAR